VQRMQKGQNILPNENTLSNEQ